MTKTLKFGFLKFIFIFSILVSCNKDNLTTIEDDFVPIIFVHGYTGSGDSYYNIIQYFKSNGYPTSKLYTYDWNTIINNAPNKTYPLNRFIQEVKAKTGYDKVNIVGHSLGGQLTFNYCEKDEFTPNINQLAWIAPYLEDRSNIPDSTILTLNIRTNTDYVVDDTSFIPNAINIVIPNKDHNEIASCEETFIELYKFFNDGTLPTTIILEDDNIEISGRVVSFIENEVNANDKIEIYEVSEFNGMRLNDSPVATLLTDFQGYFKNFQAKKNTYYEFEVSTGKPGDRPIHHYFEPFKNSSHLLYLRTYPPRTSILNVGLSSLFNFSDSQGISIFISFSKALWLGRDELTINDYDCINTTFAEREYNSLGLFMADYNRNSISDNTSNPVIQSLLGFGGIDMSLPIGGFSSYTYNDRTLHTHNWPSASDGISVAVFY
jgi:esterase/lipase